MALTAFVPRTHATVTTIGYWRMGENDPGAVPGVMSATVDAVGGRTLFGFAAPFYSPMVAGAATAHTGSTLCLWIFPGTYATASVISNLTANFGIELWVYPNSLSGTRCLVYNGNTGTNGCGLYEVNGNYEVLFGGETFLFSVPAAQFTWTHLALVQSNTASGYDTALFVNGVAASFTDGRPIKPPVGAFGVGAAPTGAGSDPFDGYIDEVRVFTFGDGQFRASDLLVGTNYTLGTSRLREGPSAGAEGVVSPAGEPWTAYASASWLHLTSTNGNGNTVGTFTFDANPGPTRTATLTFNGQPVAITQAGATYVAAATTTLPTPGLGGPNGVAVDGSGNVYFSDSGIGAIEEWVAASNSVRMLVTNGLSVPSGVALDSGGNVYFADRGNSAVKEWLAASNSVRTLVSSGLNSPLAVAVDSSGNVYIADTANQAVKEWVAPGGPVRTLVSSSAGFTPLGVGVDSVGDVFFTPGGIGQGVYVWRASSNSVSQAVSSVGGLEGVALDSLGDIYATDYAGGLIQEFNLAGSTITRASGLNRPTAVAVNGAGDIFIADSGNGAIKELPRAFVDSTPRFETAPDGSDALPAALTQTVSLTGIFQPTSDQSWLSITGITNGVVSFAFTANNTATNRIAHIDLLGQSVLVTQFAAIMPVTLTGAMTLPDGHFQFSFTNNSPGTNLTFTVLSTTNVTAPLTNWTVVGTASSIAPNLFQFTDPQPASSQRYYSVLSQPPPTG